MNTGLQPQAYPPPKPFWHPRTELAALSQAAVDQASLQPLWQSFLIAENSSQQGSATSSLGLVSASPFSFETIDLSAVHAQPYKDKMHSQGRIMVLAIQTLLLRLSKLAWAWGWRHLLTLAVVPQDVLLILFMGQLTPPLVSGGSSSVSAWTLLCPFPTPSHLPTPAFDFPQSLDCGYTLHFLVLRYQAGIARAWDEWENCHWPSMSPRAPWLHRDPPK